MATMHFMSGHIPEGIGNGHFVHVPYNCYPTADGHVIVACIGDAFFERFVQCMEIPALRKPQYMQQPARFSAKTEIDALVSEEFRKLPTAHWLGVLNAARIPCGPVNNFAQTLSDPQVLARGMVAEVTLLSGEVLRMPGNPVKLSGAQATAYTAPPALGAQTTQVLGDWLGYSPEKLNQLRALGTVA